jgi:hypothetical protein
MVQELRNSELIRATYKLLKFIGKTRIERNMEIISTILPNEKWMATIYISPKVTLVYFRNF